MVKHLMILTLIIQAVLLFALMTDYSPFRYGLLNDWLLVAFSISAVYSWNYIYKY